MTHTVLAERALIIVTQKEMYDRCMLFESFNIFTTKDSVNFRQDRINRIYKNSYFQILFVNSLIFLGYYELLVKIIFLLCNFNNIFYRVYTKYIHITYKEYDFWIKEFPNDRFKILLQIFWKTTYIKTQTIRKMKIKTTNDLIKIFIAYW